MPKSKPNKTKFSQALASKISQVKGLIITGANAIYEYLFGPFNARLELRGASYVNAAEDESRFTWFLKQSLLLAKTCIKGLANKILNIASLIYNYGASPRAETLNFTQAMYELTCAPTHAEARKQYILAKSYSETIKEEELKEAFDNTLLLANSLVVLLKVYETTNDSLNANFNSSWLSQFENEVHTFMDEAKVYSDKIQGQANAAWQILEENTGQAINGFKLNLFELDLLANCSCNILGKMHLILGQIKEKLSGLQSTLVASPESPKSTRRQLDFSSPLSDAAASVTFPDLESNDGFSRGPSSHPS